VKTKALKAKFWQQQAQLAHPEQAQAAHPEQAQAAHLEQAQAAHPEQAQPLLHPPCQMWIQRPMRVRWKANLFPQKMDFSSNKCRMEVTSRPYMSKTRTAHTIPTRNELKLNPLIIDASKQQMSIILEREDAYGRVRETYGRGSNHYLNGCQTQGLVYSQRSFCKREKIRIA
jgi:hypothetical protein